MVLQNRSWTMRRRMLLQLLQRGPLFRRGAVVEAADAAEEAVVAEPAEAAEAAEAGEAAEARATLLLARKARAAIHIHREQQFIFIELQLWLQR